MIDEARERARAAGFDPERLEHALGLLRRACASGAFPGGVVLVERRGMRVVHEAMGFTSYGNAARPVTVETVYDVASLTKPMATVTSVLRLMELGEVNLDDGVARYLPGVADGITLVHLLTHTGGLVADAPLWEMGGAGGREACVRAAMALAKAEALEARPGAQVRYSCIGFILLGLVVEKVAGEGLEAFARREVFEKLGMGRTGFYTVERFVEREAVAPTERRSSCQLGQRFWERLRQCGMYLDLHTADSVAWGAVHDENALAMGGVSGNAGLFSTADDVAKLARMYLAGERAVRTEGDEDGAVQVLSPATVELATRNYTAGMGENRGLGWQLATPGSSFGNLMSPRAFGHTGFTGTAVWADPVRDLVIVLLTNRVHPTRENLALVNLRPKFVNTVVAAITR
ncbi:MAG: serine hydrolase [Bacillota bacterium]|jgi:CubicO group peptidase (beta-lactamase class C family)|nr:serine hydrolase [Bacillota bacterium]